MTSSRTPHPAPSGTTDDAGTDGGESLLTIGAFARAAGLSASALRYYDEVGLLPASHVDPANGYRWYDAQQQERARLLATLRGLELSIAQMTELLALSPVDLAGRLEALADEQLDAGRSRALALRSTAEQLVRAALPMPEAASARACPAQAVEALRRVAAVRGEAPFDGVLLTMEHGRACWWATDRYRLVWFELDTPFPDPATAEPTVPDAEAGSARLVVDVDHIDQVMALFNPARAASLVRVEGARLLVDDKQLDLSDAGQFADIPALGRSFTRNAHTRLLIDRNQLLAGDGQVVVEHDGVRVRLTRELLEPAVREFCAGTLLVELAGDEAPVTLSAAALPAHRLVIMPRHD